MDDVMPVVGVWFRDLEILGSGGNRRVAFVLIRFLFFPKIVREPLRHLRSKNGD